MVDASAQVIFAFLTIFFSLFLVFFPSEVDFIKLETSEKLNEFNKSNFWPCTIVNIWLGYFVFNIEYRNDCVCVWVCRKMDGKNARNSKKYLMEVLYGQWKKKRVPFNINNAIEIFVEIIKWDGQQWLFLFLVRCIQICFIFPFFFFLFS